MGDAVFFGLVLAALHVVTLLSTWGVFEGMFRRGLAARSQVDGGKAPKAEMLRRCVREVLGGQLFFFVLCAAVVYPLWTARGGRVDGT